ncbi:MAG TPA: signal recognition particle-docking protein FtsY [Rhodospirillales bacterium]|jgi:fused signal recognition particle receptor|nr:signal recognition particle-docking protein FtsY [Rhodospirillales bacterium]
MNNKEHKEIKSGWLSRLKGGLSRSSSVLSKNINDLLTKRKLDDAAIEELEEILITSDLGVSTAARLSQSIASSRFGKETTSEEIKAVLASEITKILEPIAIPLEPDAKNTPHVIVVCGVNGVGKTTTIGKLARAYTAKGQKVVLAAGDTFRTAAIEQLEIWGQRTNSQVISSEIGKDAASLAYDAFEQAKKTKAGILLIDTAGRLQNKKELMAELQKIIRVIRKIDHVAPHSCLLVLDATTGQNTHSQVEVFADAINITGLIVTKLDGSSKGGVLVSLAEKFGLPVHAIGIGEQPEDLQPFKARDFANSLMGLE